MQHNFRDFLTRGGSGGYTITQFQGAAWGRNEATSIKSLFPGYAELRSDFSDRLDSVASQNARMLLNTLTPPDSAPSVTEVDLRDVSDAKEAALSQWDEGLAAILDQYETHPQRLRPLRASLEERLLRAFAGLINQLRQQDLGIEQYIWRSQDDAKVRDSHAQYDDQVFRWDSPPAGGHPGQAYNCRCYAEPIRVDALTNLTLIEYVPTSRGYPRQDLLQHEAKGGHTIADHVGKSEGFLIESVSIPKARALFYSVYRWRHGSFPSVEAAEKLTNSNLSQNAEIVNAVATGQLAEAFVTSTFASVTGIEALRLSRRASSPVQLRTTMGVGTFIQHAPDMPNGFIIITSYPRSDQ